MATQDVTKAPPGPEAGIQPADADVLPFTPHPPDGDFCDPLAALARNPVVDRELLEISEFEHGKTTLEVFTLENGRHYEVVSGVPAHQRSDIGIDEGTALATSVRGHNWRTMRRMMKLGFPATMIGPEGGHQRWPRTPLEAKRFVGNLISISIVETAANMHEILDVLDGDEETARTPGMSIKLGESRDAALAIAFSALAPQFEREVIYTDGIAPCFPNADPLRLSPSLVPRAFQLAAQVGSLARNATPLSPRGAAHYARTVNLNPHFMAHAAATIPTLVSGQVGTLAQRIDPEARMHFTHFTGDPWDDIPAWEERFKDYPFVVHDSQPGDHGAIARRDTQANQLVRLEGLRDELEAAQQRPEGIDWEHVYLGGQLAVAAA